MTPADIAKQIERQEHAAFLRRCRGVTNAMREALIAKSCEAARRKQAAG